MEQETNKVKRLNQHIGQNGVAAVEFAVVLTLLVTLVFGIIDVGLMVYNKQVITNASREGAREGIKWSTTPTIKSVVVNYCTNRLFPPGAILSDDDINVSGGGAFQSDLTVTVTYIHHFMFAGIIGLDPTITMVGRTIMKMQYPPSP